MKVENVTPDELIEIVRRIQRADDGTDYYVRLLHSHVLHPRVSSLIFFPPSELADASPADIVDATLSYRPIAL
ncbi:bacteriocin immunity protein [Micromonospora sp. A3M-1-15]|uniref:bacteriocin immunity protein n=1 Tax=Micromonospora sp. A3M-1-15 TaxID=2962035 RepID=UPI0035ADC727